MRFKQFKNNKPAQVNEEDLLEISMKPSILRQLAADINAKAGMEFEMIVPNVAGDEDYDNLEPDWDSDESSRSFSNIEDFFYDGDYNGRREVQRMIERMQEKFYEWADVKIDQDWVEEQFDMVKEWVINNVQDEDILDFGEYDDEDREKFAEDPEFRTKVIKDYVDNAIEDQTSDYDAAREEYMDDMRGDVNESEWLDEEYPTMSDIANGFDINWPHYYNPNTGDTDIDSVADSFKDDIGKPVVASSSYHSAKRNDTDYIVEPDSSLEASGSDGGLEFISPPMPVDEMFSDMDKIVNWANNYGCYTNNSTGLHMNISVPNMSTAKLDFVKLALLMGDEYVLGQFGRIANSYAKSAMKLVRDRVAQRPEDAEAMLGQMKEHLGALASKVIHSGETTKYTSINTKDGYVEFRSPGGDWLDDYNSDKGKIENTMLRFVVALDAAMDPEKYRQDYLKKLYKLLDIKKETDPLKYFALYATGEMPQIALKSFLKQAQLERRIKKGDTGGKDFKWEIGRPGYGASIIVVAKSKEEAIDKALAPDGYPDWASARNQLTVKPIGPADTSAVKATVNEPRPAGEAGSNKYEMFNRGSGIVMRTFYAANDEMALDMGNRYREQAMAEFGLDRSTIGLRASREQPPSQTTQQDSPIGGEFSGTWLVKDANGREIHRFSGVGNQQGDANRIAMAWLRQDPRRFQDGIEVVPLMR